MIVYSGEDMLRKFTKEYPMIVWASFISCVVIFLYVIFERRLHNFTVVAIVFQLAVGIIINSLFFYTQIYLAQKKQREYANVCITNRINNIQDGMREIFDRLSELYLSAEERTDLLDEEQLLLLLQRTKMEDTVKLINPTKDIRTGSAEYTVREFITLKLELIERGIDRLCTYYNQYISPDLLMVFELITDSEMHNIFARKLMQSYNGVSFNNCNHDIYYKPYFELIGRLEDIKKQYE